MAQFTPTVDVGGRQVTLAWSSPFPGLTELAWGPTSAPSFTAYPNHFTAPGSGNAHSATLRRLPPGTWFVRARTGSTESMEQTVVVPDDGAPLADWAFEGTVNALLRHGSSWYVGGDFSSVGRTTGGGAPTLADGGLPLHFPEVAGQVFAVEPDGAGGLYIGGSFTSVGGLPRRNVAHLFPSLGVDPVWKPACNGSVYAIQLGVSGSVYLGGLFTTVSGQSRRALAEVSPIGLLTTWSPDVNGYVLALARVSSNSSVYFSGNFTTVNGQGRAGLAAVNGAGIVQPWSPSVSGGRVLGLTAVGSTLYANGDFTGIGMELRPGVAALDSTTGAVLAWSPPVTGGFAVNAVAPGPGDSLFIGGNFTQVGPLSRVALALVDADAGQPLPWNAALTGGRVQGLAFESGAVYAVGDFVRAGAQVHAANFSATTASPLTWRPRFNGLPRVVAVQPSGPFVGGDFTGLREQPRTGLAAIGTSGALEPFAPTLGGATFGNPSVNALAAQGSSLVVGGTFSVAGGSVRNNAAMITTGSGQVASWNPNVGGTVWALAVVPGAVLLGGQFSQINGGTPRSNGAIVDATTAAAVSFNPPFISAVFGIATEGATSYWVGGFGPTSGLPRNHAAEFNLPSGALDGWNPSVTTDVKAVHVVGNTVALGGAFQFVNGSTFRQSLAVFDRIGGVVTPFDARLVIGEVRALTSVGNTLYAGGNSLFDAGLLIAADLPSSVVRDVEVQGQTDPFFSTKPSTVQALALDCAAQRIGVGGAFHASGLTPVGGATLIGAPCDAGVVDGDLDAGVFDAGVFDAGVDAGVLDAGVDAGVFDAGVDAGVFDAGVDAGVFDAGFDAGPPLDAGEPDGGTSGDAGTAADGGASDAGVTSRDAGGPDGGGGALDAGDGSGTDGGRGLVFVPVSCGCSGVDQAPLGLGLLLALLVRRRSTR